MMNAPGHAPTAVAASPLGRAWALALERLNACLSGEAHAPAALLEPLRDEPRFAWLLDTFGLDDVDAACLLLAIAPDIDAATARRFASLRRRGAPARPDGALLQTLLCATLDERIALQAHLSWDAPLLRHRLLQPVDLPRYSAQPLHAAGLAVDPQVLRTLCYGDWLDPRVARYGRLLQPLALTAHIADDTLPQPAADLLHAASERAEPLQLLFRGPPGSGRRDAAHRLASRHGARLLVVNLGHAHALGEFAELTAPLLREAWLLGAWLYLEDLESVPDSAPFELQRFLEDLAEDSGICIIAATQTPAFGGRKPLAPITVEFDTASYAQARQSWCMALNGNADVSQDDVDLLARRYRLPLARMHAAVTQAGRLARTAGGADALPAVGELVRASRALGQGGLAGLARKVDPAHGWDDLVLPDDAQRQLRELCARVEHSVRVFHHWGFGPRLSLGRGVSALFAGASGTGKTMAAEVIAAELGLDLYKIDLATVVSKYIGETEKNLERVFTAARQANAVLLFDEADALFGKRSEVRDAHDRYANLEIAYLLQKMEEYDGLSILSTNLKQNLDEAFLRRLTYTVLFPFPAAPERERIWRANCPPLLPLEDDVDFAALARSFKLSGGNIRNALLAAAFFAADGNSGRVGMPHLVHGVRRELQKAGKHIGELDVRSSEAAACHG